MPSDSPTPLSVKANNQESLDAMYKQANFEKSQKDILNTSHIKGSKSLEARTSEFRWHVAE